MWPDAARLFDAHRATLAGHGVTLRARLEPIPGLMCATTDGVVGLALPSLDSPEGALRATLLSGLMGLSLADVEWLFHALLPRLVAHEIGHALRMEHHRLGNDRRDEEQIADRLGVLLSRPHVSRADRARALAILHDVTGRLGGVPEAVAMHRDRALAQRVLGLAAVDPAAERDARERLQRDYFRDVVAYLRLTAAWAWIDLSLDLEEDFDDFDATTSQPDTGWLPAAVNDLESLARVVTPPLGRRLDAALARLARMNGGTSLLDALSRPASTPFVPLIDACARDLGLAGHPAVALLGRSTVLLYVYVRVQDDLVDEPDRVDRASVFAAEALLARHLALFAEATARPEAFAVRADVMTRFAEVAAAEVDGRSLDGIDSENLGWMGEKFLPMAVPLVGLASVARALDRAPSLVAFVREIGTALQLINDAFNVAEDAAAGRSTPVLGWLRDAGVSTTDPTALAGLLGHPVMDRVMREARRYADAATARARDEGWHHTAAIGARVGAMVDRCPERMLKLMLGMSV